MILAIVQFPPKELYLRTAGPISNTQPAAGTSRHIRTTRVIRRPGVLIASTLVYWRAVEAEAEN